MVVMIASSFYTEFELYETTYLEDLKRYLTNMVNGRFTDLDTRYHKLVASQDTIETQEAIRVSDTILFDVDLEED